jgi:DNA-binding CsgD family transcriptional regulator
MKTTTVGPKEERLLALLAEGGSTRTVARKMRHSEGTVRVYLHRLYKTIGVRNRTEAVLWYLHRGRAASAAAAQPAAAAAPLADESFGEVALREGLLGALGIMESFLGPYGRIWQAGARLKGAAVDSATLARRGQARALWRALLAGDFAYGKRVHDGRAHEPAQAAGVDDVLLALLLQIGGYSRAADQLTSHLGHGKAGQGVSAREVQLLRTVRDAVDRGPADGLAALQRAAPQAAGTSTLRQTSLAALFHVSLMRRDFDGAREAANALWGEADAARSQLEAMGIRLLPRPATAPRSRPAGAATAPSAKAAETAR